MVGYTVLLLCIVHFDKRTLSTHLILSIYLPLAAFLLVSPEFSDKVSQTAHKNYYLWWSTLYSYFLLFISTNELFKPTPYFPLDVQYLPYMPLYMYIGYCHRTVSKFILYGNKVVQTTLFPYSINFIIIYVMYSTVQPYLNTVWRSNL